MTCGHGSRHGSVYEFEQGGDHAKLTVVKARSGEYRWILDAETTAIIRDLARLLPDAHIASVLNRAGKRTGRDNVRAAGSRLPP